MRVKYPLSVALRLQALHRQLNAQMKIKITEPVFFLHKDRKPGDVLENVKTGPHRNRVIAGGLELTPQFIEMAEENKETTEPVENEATPPIITVRANVTPPPPGSFGDALASINKPNGAAKPVSRTAALLSGLAGRRRKLEETIVTEATAYAEKLGEVEANVPDVFSKAKASLDDRQASLVEIDESLIEFLGANTDPLQR